MLCDFFSDVTSQTEKKIPTQCMASKYRDRPIFLIKTVLATVIVPHASKRITLITAGKYKFFPDKTNPTTFL